MKTISRKLGALVILLSVLGFINSISNLFGSSEVNSETYTIESSEVNQVEHLNKWVTLSLGIPDILNTFEMVTETRKTNIELSNTYYFPIFGGDSQIAYILKTKDENIFDTTVVSGLISAKSEIDSELLTEFNKIYPNQNYVLFDETYIFTSKGDYFIVFIVSIILLVFGLFLRKIGRVKPVMQDYIGE